MARTGVARGRRRPVLVLVLAAAALAGCSDDGAAVSAAEARADAYAYTAVDFGGDPQANIELLRIPEEELADLSTPALVWSVLDFPYVGNAFASSQAGGEVAFLAEQCDALDELLERDDAHEAVLAVREEYSANGAAEDEFSIMKLRLLDLMVAEVAG